MFTGIVSAATVAAIEPRDGGASTRLVVDVGEMAEGVGVGDSVAVNGCCLTAVAIDGGRLSFDCVAETMRLTSLGELAAGRKVNVELSLRPADRMGGHFVTGHVDGTGAIARLEAVEGETILEVRCDPSLTEQLVLKGSIAIDGISLTLTAVEPEMVRISLIPHTLEVTNLGEAAVGQTVNVETDLLGKYVQRYMGLRSE